MKLDRGGSSSFALVAVLLFLSMVLAHTYMGRLDMERSRSIEEARQALETRDAVWKCYVDVRSQASFAALSALALSKQTGGSADVIFADEMDRYVRDTFPRYIGGVRVDAFNTSWDIGLERARTIDLVPLLEEEIMTVDRRREERLSASRNSAIGETHVPLSPSAIGYIEFEASTKSSILHFERDVDVPLGTIYPFILDRMVVAEAGMHGGLMGVGRTMQYILTTLAQYRVFQGVASPGSQTGMADVLSPWDVEIAVNIAVYMEQLKAFRAVDPDSLKAFDERNMPLVSNSANVLVDGGMIESVGERSMSSLLGRYLRDGTVDAADLLALFLCLDSEHISIDMIIAQSLNTILDQLVLKYMTYFSLPSRDPDVSGFQISNAEAARFSRHALSNMDMAGTVHVPSETFDTGEIATTMVNSTLGFSTKIVEPGVLESQSILRLHPRELPREEPDVDALPVGSREFYALEDPWCSVHLDFLVSYVNSTYSVRVDSRGIGGEWDMMASWDGGGVGNGSSPVSIILSSSLPWDGMEFRISTVWDGGMNDSAFVMNVTRAEVMEFYGGKWVNKTALVSRAMSYYQNTAHNVGLEMQKDGSILDVWGYIKDFVHTFFATLLKDISSMICDMLFGNARPMLPIDPWDSKSIIDTMHSTTNSWIHTGTSKLRAVLKDEERLEQLAQDIIDRVFRDMMEKIWGVLDVFWSGVSRMIDTAKSILVNSICSMVNALGGAAAEVVNFITFGLIDTSDVRTHITDMVSGAVEYWEAFESRIRDALRVVMEHITSFIEGCVDAFGRLLVNIASRLSDLVDRLIGDVVITVNGLVSYMMRGGAVSAVEYRDTLVKDDGDAYMGRFVFSDEVGGTQEHSLAVTQMPSYISKDTGFNVGLGAPVGVHYTAPTSISRHPYETVWEISVRGNFTLSVKGDNVVYTGGGVLSSHVQDVALNVSIPVTVFSGWPLEGLNYEASNTLIDDLKDLFHRGWEKLSSVFEGLVHFLKKAADIFSRLLQEVMSRAMWIVDTLETAFQKTMDLMTKLLTSTGYHLASQLIGILAGSGNVLGPITVFGYSFLVVQNRDDGSINVSLRQQESFEAWIVMGSEDSSLHFDMSFWHLHASGGVDSLLDREYRGVVEWNNGGHGWLFDFHGPHNHTYSEAKLSVAGVLGRGITVPTPAGPATIDFGLLIRMDVDRINASLEEELGPLGGMLLAGPGAMAEQFGGNASAEAVAELARGVAGLMLDGEPLQRIMNVLEEFSLSTTLEFFLEVKFGAGGTGVSFTLSFVIDNPVFVLLDLTSWLYEEIRGLVSGALSEPMANGGGVVTASPRGGLKQESMENISVRLTVGGGTEIAGRELSLGLSANLPAIGAVCGKDWGIWRIHIDLTYTKAVGSGEWMDKYEAESSFVGLVEERTWI